MPTVRQTTCTAMRANTTLANPETLNRKGQWSFGPIQEQTVNSVQSSYQYRNRKSACGITTGKGLSSLGCFVYLLLRSRKPSETRCRTFMHEFLDEVSPILFDNFPRVARPFDVAASKTEPFGLNFLDTIGRPNKLNQPPRQQFQ